MQFIKSQYAVRYNKTGEQVRPFWNERFSDRIFEEYRFPVKEFNRQNSGIMHNPVKWAMYRRERYKYSSIDFYVDENASSPVKLIFHEYYMALGGSFQERADKLLRWGEKSSEQ